jgi:hypothetical protein
MLQAAVKSCPPHDGVNVIPWLVLHFPLSPALQSVNELSGAWLALRKMIAAW